MIRFPYSASQFLHFCCIALCMVLLHACSSSTEAEKELFRDGVHTGLLNDMGEEMFNKFEHELNVNIHRGENPPDVVSALENIHSQNKNKTSSDATTSDMLYAYHFDERFIKENTGVTDPWVVEHNNNNILFWAWFVMPYGYQPDLSTIETRHWIHYPGFSWSCPETCHGCICELSGSSEWAYVMGGESNFTISAMVNYYWQVYDPVAVSFEEYKPWGDILVMFSGTISERGIENPELGLILNKAHDEGLTSAWPEGEGITINTSRGWIWPFPFDKNHVTPWPD